MPPCVSEADRFSLEALRHIHKQLDDDNDGGIEVNESVEFIIEDMKQQQTNKHSNLHREDQHITVEELWRGWKTCEVVLSFYSKVETQRAVFDNHVSSPISVV
ncbi:Stromal interaction molecule 2 [Characodon lateralis]|uniref:Stromal interaction molecule 2 n=1 Tax=Characodon lateralis TaxID=208331 RepID=A0ABU7CY88_9TELE|nr:Stromal interaction molecule 2 [Characodon lateralis]